MFSFGRWAFRLTCLLLGSGLASAGDQVPFRLAVTGPGQPELVSLLETALSRFPGLALVERDELQRLVDERRLTSLLTERNFGALGQILSAEGVLVIEKIRFPQGTEEVTARLVSVKNGACLAFAPVPASLSPEEWAEGFSEQVVRALPMARIAREEALAVCLVGLRSSLFTPELVAQETALARLIEAKLGSVPGLILLERRYLEDITFERSLEASDLPSLWPSAVLIDGTLEESGSPPLLNAALRLRSRDGSSLGSVSAQKANSELPALAGELSKLLLSKLDKSSQEPAGGIEPREFFEEAVWAWRSGLFEHAEEALAAAIALGEKTPDALALKAWLLAERACPEGVFFHGKYLKREPPDAARQVALTEESLVYLEKFVSEGGHLKHLKGQAGRDLQLPQLRKAIIERVSGLLRENDGLGAPVDAEGVRRRVREAVQMAETNNPLRGQTLASNVRHWESSGTDLVRSYERLLRARRSESSFLQYFPDSSEAVLGRFQDAGTRKEWQAMTERLRHDPETRPVMLFVLAGRAKTPAEASAYREFLLELTRSVKTLGRSGELDALLWGDLCRQESFWKFGSERSEALVALCETAPDFARCLLFMTRGLKVPPEMRERVWTSLMSYRDRCLKAAGDAKQRALIEQHFSEASGDLLAGNPDLRPKGSASSLQVTRFWHPYDLKGWEKKDFVFNEIQSAESSVWLVDLGIENHEVLEVKLPEFRLIRHPVSGAGACGSLAVSPKAVWVLHGAYPDNDRPMQKFLARLDRTTSAVQQVTLPRGEDVELAVGRVFVRFGHPHVATSGGLLEVDPETGSVAVLISARRQPPSSPVDASVPMGVSGVGMGPGGAVKVVVSGQSAGIYDLGGDWKKSPSVFWPDVLHWEDLTLLAGAKGEAILLDPRASEPVWWMASPDSEAEVRKKSRWMAPRPHMDMRFGAASFRKDELFVVERNGAGEHALRWWFEGGPREGLSIPLRFSFPKDQIPESQRKSADAGQYFFGAAVDPNRRPHNLQVLSSDAGVILHSGRHGLWFIPNSDLNAWRRRAAVDWQSSAETVGLTQNVLPAAPKESANREAIVRRIADARSGEAENIALMRQVPDSERKKLVLAGTFANAVAPDSAPLP